MFCRLVRSSLCKCLLMLSLKAYFIFSVFCSFAVWIVNQFFLQLCTHVCLGFYVSECVCVSLFFLPADFPHRKQLCSHHSRSHGQWQDNPGATVHSGPLQWQKYRMQHCGHPTTQNWGLQYCTLGCHPAEVYTG